MAKARKARFTTALTLGVAMLLTPVAPWKAMQTAHAAASAQSDMSQEEAVQWAKKWITIPQDYLLENATYRDPLRDLYYTGKPSWQLVWQKGRDGHISVSIDAKTGRLVGYFFFDPERGNAAQTVSPEQALESAMQFLARVADKAELQKLSKPNEYGQNSYMQSGEHTFTFTRVENGTPFLENGFRLTVGRNGQVVQFQRDWYEGALPDPKQAIPLEQEERLLEEKTAPSLVYTRMDWLTGNYGPGNHQYQLVYQYHQHDPQMIDALKGVALNALGEAAEPRQIKALGTAISKPQPNVITKEEAQKIAETVIKKLPGSYRNSGISGSGTSEGADGIIKHSWHFRFIPLNGKETDSIELGIDDRGQLNEFRAVDREMPRVTGRKFEKAVPWEQAEANAVNLVKRLMDDRLGEIYLIGEKPSEDTLKLLLEKGQMYSVNFGWLKDGVPIETARFEVRVNPENGEAVELNLWSDGWESARFAPAGQKVDVEVAKKAEREQKKAMLTYYMPQPLNYLMGTSGNSEPLLVYRYVGDSGVVDATTGEWISFAKLREQQLPQDIADHPAKEALLYAVDMNLLEVKDGKLEPDKPLTRGEMAVMMARIVNLAGFHERLYRPFYFDEESKQYLFEDVDQKHPLFAAVQKGIQYGLIPKEGKRFEPERAITRAEAAEMAVRLLGYGELLQKHDIFRSPYQDIKQEMLPLAALAHAFGLFTTSAKDSFQPDSKLTRAEAAQLIKRLKEVVEQE